MLDLSSGATAGELREAILNAVYKTRESEGRVALLGFLKRLRQNVHTADPSAYSQTVEEIQSLAQKLSCKHEEYFHRRMLEVGEAIRAEKTDERFVTEVYALASEAARRTLGFNLFRSQLVAALALHDGYIVQMNTGEGKTLAAVLPACLNSLHGMGCHVLTFNDYLARRDAEWMGPIYRMLGIQVGVIQKGMPGEQRKKQYRLPVTYATAREVGFDHLRDDLAYSMEEILLRSLEYAIVDEADSILIDSARIPLVVAGESRSNTLDPFRIAEVVGELREHSHWERDETGRNIYFTEEGIQILEQRMECSNLHDSESSMLLAELSFALHARILLLRNIDYIVRENRIQMIDQFTGRVAPDRRWPEGLQRALEAKEKLPVLPGGRILSSIPMQYFIELYPKLSGLTATAASAQDEFSSFYGTQVICIPPERESLREDREDLVFTHLEAKREALLEEICRQHKTGRPVLVGTESVDESENLADLLRKRQVACKVLNAGNDRLEAEIIADAGVNGAITISTNMAGRGTDIKLGGKDESHRDKIVSLGGLLVLGTNRHESKRIDDQLRGRAGRQGDPGTTCFFISLKDDLMNRYDLHSLLSAKGWPEDQDSPLESELIHCEVNRLQKIVEEQNYYIRKALREYSSLLELQRRSLMAYRRSTLQLSESPTVFSENAPDHRLKLSSEIDGKALLELEKRIMLYCIDQCWADHLADAAQIQEGIHLVSVGGLDPLQEFHKTVYELYHKVLQRIEEMCLSLYLNIQTRQDVDELESALLRTPDTTWTYLVDYVFSDDLEQIFLTGSSSPFTAMAVFTTWPLLLIGVLRKWWGGRS